MSNTSDTEKEEEMLCPLCLEELDLTDRNFRPCTCGYQMCRFCWHHVKENLNGRCPACRKEYAPENYSFVPPDPEELAKMVSLKKQRERERKKKEKANNPDLSKSGDIIASRKNLSNVRVIQRNLVYVTNLALSAAKEEILRKHEYFGQYGKILKVVINKNNLYNVSSPGGPSVSAYVTYYKSLDALTAIKAVDGSWLGGRTLRASFGTTKYCTYFLKDVPCTNPDCMYLHELGGDTDSFTKEEMAVGKSTFHHQIHPTANRPQRFVTSFQGQTVLPPPGSGNDSEELEDDYTIEEPVPEESYQPPPPTPVEEEEVPSTSVSKPPTKSVWKSVVVASTPTTTQPTGATLTLDTPEWPKPAAAVAIATSLRGSGSTHPTHTPPASSLRNSQERGSALPPTASWAQKPAAKVKGTAVPSPSIAQSTEPPKSAAVTPPVANTEDKPLSHTTAQTPTQTQPTQPQPSTVTPTPAPTQSIHTEPKQEKKKKEPTPSKKSTQTKLVFSITEPGSEDTPAEPVSKNAKDQKSPRGKAATQKSQQAQTASPRQETRSAQSTQTASGQASASASTSTQKHPSNTKSQPTKSQPDTLKGQGSSQAQTEPQTQPTSKALKGQRHPPSSDDKEESPPQATKAAQEPPTVPAVSQPATSKASRQPPSSAAPATEKSAQQPRPSSAGPSSKQEQPPQPAPPKPTASKVKQGRDWSEVVAPRAGSTKTSGSATPSYAQTVQGGTSGKATTANQPAVSRPATTTTQLVDDDDDDGVLDEVLDEVSKSVIRKSLGDIDSASDEDGDSEGIPATVHHDRNSRRPYEEEEEDVEGINENEGDDGNDENVVRHEAPSSFSDWENEDEEEYRTPGHQDENEEYDDEDADDESEHGHTGRVSDRSAQRYENASRERAAPEASASTRSPWGTAPPQRDPRFLGGTPAWGAAGTPAPKSNSHEAQDFDPWSELRLVDFLAAQNSEAAKKRSGPPGLGSQEEEEDERYHSASRVPSASNRGAPAGHEPGNVQHKSPAKPPGLEPMSWVAAVETGMPRAPHQEPQPQHNQGSHEQHQAPQPQQEAGRPPVSAVAPPGLSGRAKSRFGFAQAETEVDPYDQHQLSSPSRLQGHPSLHPHPHPHPVSHQHMETNNFLDGLDDGHTNNHPSHQHPPTNSVRTSFPTHPVRHETEPVISSHPRMGTPEGMMPSNPPNDMQQTLRALLPNVNISFQSTPNDHPPGYYEGWDGIPKQSVSPLFNPSSPWGPVSQKPIPTPHAWGPHLATAPSQPSRQNGDVVMHRTGPPMQRPPQQLQHPQQQQLQRAPMPQGHLPLPIPQNHPLPPSSTQRSSNPSGGAPRPSSASTSPYDSDPWGRGPAPSVPQGMMKPKGQQQSQVSTNGPATSSSKSGRPSQQPLPQQQQQQQQHHQQQQQQKPLMGNFQDPAIMMMAPQGLGGGYGGNPWGLDPTYGAAAYSMSAVLPPGLMMPMMAPHQGGMGGPGAGPAPGFPYGVGGPAVVNAYARAAVSAPPKSKYPPNGGPSSQPSDPSAKRPPSSAGRRKN